MDVAAEAAAATDQPVDSKTTTHHTTDTARGATDTIPKEATRATMDTDTTTGIELVADAIAAKQCATRTAEV